MTTSSQQAHAPWRALLSRLIPIVAPIIAVAVGLLVLGWWGSARQPPPELVLTGPDVSGAYLRTAERMIGTAQRRVWVMMYVVRVDEDVVGALLQHLVDAHQRGVEVRVVLDRSNRYGSDEPDNKNDAAMAWLRDRGIDARWDELTRTSHAKILIADDTALLGSHNWTRAALTTNRESSIVLRDRAQVETLADLIRQIPAELQHAAAPSATAAPAGPAVPAR